MTDDPRTGDAPLLLGIDAGGSVVEAVVAGTDGSTLGVGRAGGANPVALPLDVVAGHLCTAVTGALGDADPARITSAVLGVPGVSRFSRDDGAQALRSAWERCGLLCEVRVVPDPVVAFAAGTTAERGAVLVGGTGTIAALIADGEMIRRIDGHGWLVGDDGSGFWLGRQAVRAVLAELDGRDEPTMLRCAVLATLIGSDQLPDSAEQQLDLLRSAIYDTPPITLARLAVLVPAAAEAGDRVAQRIVDRCVTLLMSTIEAMLPAGAQAEAGPGAEAGPRGENGPGGEADSRAEAGPLVLAGSLLTSPGPIGREVRRRAARWCGQVPLVAGSGAGGAAWLAARQLGPNPGPVIHERLTARELSPA
jgi:N-acetylglucosamine kinase-like BadF-type ATPase